MKATMPFIQDSFAKYNNLCFDGALPPIPIKLTYARTFLGKVTYRGIRGLFGNVIRYENYCLRISTYFDLPENELEDVVIHEMIHYYIALNNNNDTSTHGKVFREIMGQINSRYGRNIAVRHPGVCGGQSERNMAHRANWLCVVQFQDGNWGITSSARTKIFDIHRGLPKYYRVRSMAWYGSMDPFFNRYPRSIKPRIYKITRDELDEHLKDSIPLKCDGFTIEPF